MQTKKFSTSVRPVILALLLGGCAAKPISFNGQQAVYHIDPMFTTPAAVAADAARQCSQTGKTAVFERQDCSAPRNCMISYRCE